MADFWNEESAREIHEYNLMKEAKEKGREEGRSEGKTEERNNGINKMIQALKEVHVSLEDIRKQLKVKYNLTDQEVDLFL